MPPDVYASLPGLALAAYTATPTWQYKDAMAVLARESGLPVVSFPGTHPDNPGDLLTDFLGAVPNLDPELGWGGLGWHDRSRGLLDLMTATGLPDGAVFVGHSLGGALAIAVGARLAARQRPPVWIETYGAPRVGRDRLARLLVAVPGKRWHRGNDPIPDVPPAWFHDRALMAVGVAQLPAIGCHSMAGYAADVAVV